MLKLKTGQPIQKTSSGSMAADCTGRKQRPAARSFYHWEQVWAGPLAGQKRGGHGHACRAWIMAKIERPVGCVKSLVDMIVLK